MEEPFAIPTSVRAAMTIRNAAENPAISPAVLEHMVSAEPSVAAALIRLANSPLLRRGASVEAVRTAVQLLGSGEVRAVASQVAMLQLVRSTQGKSARWIAENLLWHAISVSTFAEALAIELGEGEPHRVATLGLFHELPSFHLLASAQRQLGTVDVSIAQVIQRVASGSPRALQLLMQDIGLPQLAAPRRDEWMLVDLAHAYTARANPIAMHAAEDQPGDQLSPQRIDRLQAQADAVYWALMGGNTHALVDERGETSVQEPAAEPERPQARPTWRASVRRWLSWTDDA